MSSPPTYLSSSETVRAAHHNRGGALSPNRRNASQECTMTYRLFGAIGAVSLAGFAAVPYSATSCADDIGATLTPPTAQRPAAAIELAGGSEQRSAKTRRRRRSVCRGATAQGHQAQAKAFVKHYPDLLFVNNGRRRSISAACVQASVNRKRVQRFKFVPWQALVAPRFLYVSRLYPLEFLCRA